MKCSVPGFPPFLDRRQVHRYLPPILVRGKRWKGEDQKQREMSETVQSKDEIDSSRAEKYKRQKINQSSTKAGILVGVVQEMKILSEKYKRWNFSQSCTKGGILVRILQEIEIKTLKQERRVASACW